MRLDYISYAIAIVFFIVTLAAAAYSVAQQQVWIVSTAVIGLVFIGLGYTQRPKSAVAAVTSNVIPSPSPPEQQQQQQPLVVVTPTVAQPIVTQEVKTEEVKPIAQPQPSTAGLTEVKGIGEKRAAQLKALGINSIKDLAEASAKDLAAKLQISPKITGKWIENAKEIGQKP
jgi:predicted flap endonuclease-1-like 5' DNA nuclease